MLAPAIKAIRERVEANFTALPMRWANENWDGQDPMQTASPFVECEIVGGYNALTGFSQRGNQLYIHPGLIRFYIWTPWNTGMDDSLEVADALALFMERTEFGRVPELGQTVRTLDFSAYDSVATDEAGNYAILLCSVPFDFYYTA
jgi:hypothetical protein